jgi:hypothetical protein
MWLQQALAWLHAHVVLLLLVVVTRVFCCGVICVGAWHPT